MDWILWFFSQTAFGFYHFFYALFHIGSWTDWSDSTNLVKFIFYGGSRELFFVVFDIFLVVTVIGFFRRPFLWAVVRVLEGISNSVGRVFAWAGLLMVLQQIVIVFLQRIFRVPEINLGPLGFALSKDLSWWAEELKLYNATIVALCCAYTFVQGGHVRVDLFYAGAKYRTKKIVDMFGSLFFMIPAMSLIWLYGWFFMWRHLVTPKIAAADKLELLERKARLLKWNVETIGFSPNGFDGYFLFKILLVGFAGMMFLQAIAFFYRSYLELIEGPESEGKYLDKDNLNDDDTDAVAEFY